MKIYNATRNRKKLEVLLKVTKRFYHKNSGMQEMTDVSMIEVCAEETVFLGQVVFILLLLLSKWLIKKNPKQKCRRNKDQLMNIFSNAHAGV